jgi:hypothetical protein
MMITVPEEESILVVPLRSNASTLLTGAPVVSVRRRLKFASLFYDRLFIESGVLRLQAGPDGRFNTDWVEFVTSTDPAGEVDRLARRWRWADEQNPALERAIPGRFIRGAVIGNADRDLALAAASGCAVTCDPLHLQVVAQRFNDDTGWGLRGYSVPILFPQVGELPWETIANLRRDPNITRFRAVLREVEHEATAETAAGDIEAAAHHAYEKHLAEASGRLDGVGAVARRAVTGIVIGGVIGAATSPVTGPLGIVVSTAAGGAVSTIQDVRNMMRQRRSRGWVSVHHRITRTND